MSRAERCTCKSEFSAEFNQKSTCEPPRGTGAAWSRLKLTLFTYLFTAAPTLSYPSAALKQYLASRDEHYKKKRVEYAHYNFYPPVNNKGKRYFYECIVNTEHAEEPLTHLHNLCLLFRGARQCKSSLPVQISNVRSGFALRRFSHSLAADGAAR